MFKAWFLAGWLACGALAYAASWWLARLHNPKARHRPLLLTLFLATGPYGLGATVILGAVNLLLGAGLYLTACSCTTPTEQPMNPSVTGVSSTPTPMRPMPPTPEQPMYPCIQFDFDKSGHTVVLSVDDFRLRALAPAIKSYGGLKNVSLIGQADRPAGQLLETLCFVFNPDDAGAEQLQLQAEWWVDSTNNCQTQQSLVQQCYGRKTEIRLSNDFTPEVLRRLADAIEATDRRAKAKLTPLTDHSNFPVLVQFAVTGRHQIFYSPEDIPDGAKFTVLKTKYSPV